MSRWRRTFTTSSRPGAGPRVQLTPPPQEPPPPFHRPRTENPALNRPAPFPGRRDRPQSQTPRSLRRPPPIRSSPSISAGPKPPSLPPVGSLPPSHTPIPPESGQSRWPSIRIPWGWGRSPFSVCEGAGGGGLRVCVGAEGCPAPPPRRHTASRPEGRHGARLCPPRNNIISTHTRICSLVFFQKRP